MTQPEVVWCWRSFPSALLELLVHFKLVQILPPVTSWPHILPPCSQHQPWHSQFQKTKPRMSLPRTAWILVLSREHEWQPTAGMKRGCETFLLAAPPFPQLGLLTKHHLRDWSQHLFFANSTFCKVLQTRKDFEWACNKQVHFSKPQNKQKFSSFSSCSKPSSS